MQPLLAASNRAISIALVMLASRGMCWSQDAAPNGPPAACSAAVDRAGDSLSLPTWRPPAGAIHGTEEFSRSVQVLLPPEIGSLVAELWGGGGGGGAGSIETFSEGGAGGGGGASGAYTRGNITVTPGTSYTLVVGDGGPGGKAYARPPVGRGQDGGPSAICAGRVALLAAEGGSGGQAARSNARGGNGGTSPSGSGAKRSDAAYRAGTSGTNGSAPLFELRGRGGVGGRAIAGRIQPAGAFGGDGGAGAMTPEAARDGMPGGPGTIVLVW